MPVSKSISNPHYAKPFHIRVAFRIWLAWRNSEVLRVALKGVGIAALGAATYLTLVALLSL